MRNTDQSRVFFPVESRQLSFDEPHNGGTVKVTVRGYKALIDPRSRRPLSVVSADYKLVTNEQAVEYGKQAFKQLFNTINTDQLEIFNVITPSTLTSCHIDLIHEGYEVNVWKKEVYLPYIRVTNSYNRSRALRFDLGFVRKLCDNGVIFEKEALQFKFSHTRKEIAGIDFGKPHGKLHQLERKFVEYAHGLSEVAVDRAFALPLMCRALGLNFNIQSPKPHKRVNAQKQLSEFKAKANAIVARYYRELGETAYAVFNAVTEYASSPTHTARASMMINTLQRRAGNWAESFGTDARREGFSLAQYVAEFRKYFVNGNGVRASEGEG